MDKPIIDYNIATIVSPSVMFGTTLGIYANIVLPELVNSIIYLIVLGKFVDFMSNKKWQSPHFYTEKENLLEKKKMNLNK